MERMEEPAIQVEGLVKRFGTVAAVDGIIAVFAPLAVLRYRRSG